MPQILYPLGDIEGEPVQLNRPQIRVPGLAGYVDLRGVDGSTFQLDQAAAHSRHSRLDQNTKTLYHMTSDKAALSIITMQEMRRGSDGLAGGGIYFAVSERDTAHKAHQKGPILRAKVRLGRVKKISSNGNSSITFSRLLQEGYDSVMIPRPGGTEYVVYNSDQVFDIRPVY